jgi:uncharacterized membrane protein YraQ (UPF0718 family)
MKDNTENSVEDQIADMTEEIVVELKKAQRWKLLGKAWDLALQVGGLIIIGHFIVKFW